MAAPVIQPVDGAVRRSLTEAKGLGEALPDLLVEARRVATTVLAGWHGRRRSGPGETFWQFRPFVPGETSGAIDWRRSARDDHLYVREKEWEAAHTIWLNADLSASMAFRSRLALAAKRDRALVLTLALAELLASAGERVGLLGLTPPLLSRNASEKLCNALAQAEPTGPVPPTSQLRRFSDVVLIGDLLDPVAALEDGLSGIAAAGARAHLIQVLDPIEETFPYAGRTEFVDPETGARHIVSRAEQYRADYQIILAAHRDRLALLCRRLGWTFLVHHTDRPATEPLLALHARLSDRHSALGAAYGRFGARAA